MLVSYKWLQEEYFDNKLPSPEEVVDALLFHSFEIEGTEEKGDDVIIDVDVLPNRAHDCLSHRGIAKELSVILGIPFSEKTIKAGFKSTEPTLTIEVEEKKLCDRYIGRIIKHIEVKESPEWLKERLEAIGQRSINALVDATNYVLFDIGQPTHVFDLGKLKEKTIKVRKSTGERVSVLGGEQVELKEDDLVITTNDTPIAIAGVKGGEKAEVAEETTGIVLESAHFDPVTVRKMSRRLGILTDSSKRFENEPTSELAEEAMEYLTRLIVQLCGTDETVVELPVDVNNAQNKEAIVLVETGHINKLLGVELADQEVADIFNRFGWDYTKTGDEFSVRVPEERFDITNSADLVEEVGRVYGYANIPASALPPTEKPKANKEFYYITEIKQVLLREGFSEVYTQSFVPKGELQMANPVAQDRPYLRASIDLSDVFEMNMRNKDLLGLEKVKIFEIGKVFTKDAEEKLVLSIKTEKKSLTINPLEEYGIDITSGDIEIPLDSIIKRLPDSVSYEGIELVQEGVKQFEPFSVYPYIVRDIAVWVSDLNTTTEELVKVIRSNAGELLVIEPRLIDEYEKDGRVSYAYRLVFQSKERTLTDDGVGEVMKKIEEAVASKGWEVR